jgi:predicted branched-subunit amino acid permease
MESRRALLRDAFAIGAATGAYGLSFGALAAAAGLSLAQACALSALMFTGASQFAFVGLIDGGAAAAAATALLVGVRNGLYGLRLSALLGVRGARRALAAQLVIDESTAMAVARESTRAARLGFWATGAAVFACWNLATLLGALAGDLLADPRTLGLDAAAPAAFVALLAPRLDRREPRVVAGLAAAAALVSVPLVPAGVPVLVAAAVAAVIAILPRPIVPSGRAAPDRGP